MRIALIKQKTGYHFSSAAGKYFEKVKGVIRDSKADVIVGPELALAGRVSTFDSPTDFGRYSARFISLLKNGQLLIPGTALVRNKDEKTLVNMAPIISKSGVSYFRKKTSTMENDIAEIFGLNYVRGNCNEGVFDHNGTSVALEICRDHGHAKLKNAGFREADLEIIVACNLSGGINPQKLVVREGGLVAFNDGGEPKRNCVYKLNDGNLEILDGKEFKDYFMTEV